MTSIDLKVGTLRRSRGLSQQALARELGVSFQTISKWETRTTLPDINLLPALAEYFSVTVDELLGLTPLRGERYIPASSGTREYWSERLEYLRRTRSSLWNSDYMEFLIQRVWGITEAVDVLDIGCGYGYLATLLLPLLPQGSTYTGIDFSQALIAEGKRYFAPTGLPVQLICQDVLEFSPQQSYGMAVCQAVLRHVGNPAEMLNKMVECVHTGGLVACIEVNRELEHDGLYIQGMDYTQQCERHGIRKLWKKEMETQGKEYAIGMKLPHWMDAAGLRDVGVRLCDRVNYVHPNTEDYTQALEDLMQSQGFDDPKIQPSKETIGYFVNHGLDRSEAVALYQRRARVAAYMDKHREELAYTHLLGLLVSFGWK